MGERERVRERQAEWNGGTSCNPTFGDQGLPPPRNDCRAVAAAWPIAVRLIVMDRQKNRGVSQFSHALWHAIRTRPPATIPWRELPRQEKKNGTPRLAAGSAWRADSGLQQQH